MALAIHMHARDKKRFNSQEQQMIAFIIGEGTVAVHAAKRGPGAERKATMRWLAILLMSLLLGGWGGRFMACGAEPAKFEKPLRAGMIGLDTSHVIAFTKAFNADNGTEDLLGVRIVAGFPGGSDIPASATRVDRFTRELREMGIEIVDSIDALIQKVDVVLLESVDGRPHLEQALPVLKARKPMFIDKPVAGSLVDAMAIFALAEKYDVPVFSSSSLRYYSGARQAADGKVGRVLGCDTYGPCEIEPTHPDFYWYGVHGVELLFACMGTGCETVSRTATEGYDQAVGKWRDGRIGSYRGIRQGAKRFGGTIFGSDQILAFGAEGGYRPLLAEVAKFFRGGAAPVSAEETIEIFAFMDAADESKRRHGAPVSLAEIIESAKPAVSARLHQLDP
jgi:predicted dehydrogenase